MKKLKIAFLLLLLSSTAGGFWWWQQQHSSAIPTDHLLLYGNVELRQVELAFNGSEHIASMQVREGERVAKGQLLASLHSDRLQARVDQAQARVEAQRQAFARLQAGARLEEINQTQAELELAEALARDAERSYHRIRDLAQRNLASQQQADDAKAAVESAAARVKAAEATLDLVLAGPRAEEIAAARAMLSAAQAELRLTRAALADAWLYAPCSGVIRNRILEPGDMASPQKPVYTLALDDPVWVRVYIEEPDLGKVRPGMQAQVSSDSFPDKSYPGWLGYISPSAEFTPKSVETTEVRTSLVYQAHVFVPNPQEELRLGMPATVRIPFAQTENRFVAAANACDTSP